MERRYERIEIVGPYKKNSSEGTKNLIRNKARLTSKLCGSPRNRERSKQRPQEIKRLALLGIRAAVFAHEVGNPLAGILLSLKCVESQLKKHEVNDPSLKSLIRGAIGEIDRLGSLLKEFRALAPEQTLDLKCTDLVKIAEE